MNTCSAKGEYCHVQRCCFVVSNHKSISATPAEEPSSCTGIPASGKDDNGIAWREPRSHEHMFSNELRSVGSPPFCPLGLGELLHQHKQTKDKPRKKQLQMLDDNSTRLINASSSFPKCLLGDTTSISLPLGQTWHPIS